MLRLAIIGCGRHSRAHHGPALAHYCKEHPGEVQLVAACDARLDAAESFVNDFGFARACDDMDALLDSEELDGCITVMPLKLNAATATNILERGLPCSIEKPPGANAQEAKQLVEVAKRTGTPHQVSMDRRFLPLLCEAKAWCDAQGKLHHISAAMLRYRRHEPTFLFDTAIHIIDALRSLAGEVKTFDVHQTPTAEPNVNWYQINFEYHTGIRADLKVFPTDGWTDETYEFFGEGFYAKVSSHPKLGCRLTCCQDDEVQIDRVIAPADYDFIAAGAYAETVQFIDCLKTGKPMSPTLEMALPSVELCEQIQERG